MTDNAPEQQADLAVTVKPLEWMKTGNPAGEIKAESYLGVFTVYENSWDCWTLDDGEAVSSHDTQEDAKSAAITECLRRVNETLDLIPDDATAALQAEKDEGVIRYLEVVRVKGVWFPITRIPDEYKDQREVVVWYRHKPHTAQWDLDWGNWWSTTADEVINPTHFQYQTLPKRGLIPATKCDCEECNWIREEFE